MRQFDQHKEEGVEEFMPSRLFIYYNERSVEGTVDQDSGAMIRDGVKSVHKLGVCPEYMCPYDVAKFTDAPAPRRNSARSRTRRPSTCASSTRRAR